MSDNPSPLPAVELDGDLCVMCFLPADTRAAELSRGTAEQLSRLLSALGPTTRAEVLAPFSGELGELLLAEQARRHGDGLARVDAEERAMFAESRATRAEARVAELGATIRLALEAFSSASHYAHFDRQGTAGANCPACHAMTEGRTTLNEALARIAEMEKR